MADRPNVTETEAQPRPVQSAPDSATAAQRSQNQEPAPEGDTERPEQGVEEQPQVAFELDPDSEAFGDADTVSVEVASFDPVEFSGGKSVKVDADHAFVLDSVPGVRRAKS